MIVFVCLYRLLQVCSYLYELLFLPVCDFLSISLPLSLHDLPSSRIRLESVKKRLGEYLSGGWDNRSDLCGTSRLAGSSLGINTLVADPPCGSLHKLLSKPTCSKVSVVAALCSMEAACHVATLVLWVGPSRGVERPKKCLALVQLDIWLPCAFLAHWRWRPNFGQLVAPPGPRGSSWNFR